MYACPYVCTYGAILRIQLAEGYQLVENKQSREQQVWCALIGYLRLWTDVVISPNTNLSTLEESWLQDSQWCVVSQVRLCGRESRTSLKDLCPAQLMLSLSMDPVAEGNR